MTARYPLRSRVAGTVPVPSASGPGGESAVLVDVGTDNAVRGTEVVDRPLSPPARSYRDVVASRPSSAAAQHDGVSLMDTELSPVSGVSPQGTTDLLPVRGVGPQVAAASLPVHGVGPQVAFVSNEFTKDDSKLTSFSSIPDDGGGPWTLVAPRRVRSAESLGGRGSASRARIGEVASPNRYLLTWEQERAIALAKEGLTSGERERIKERNVRLNIPDVQRKDTFVQGSSNLKGKGADPGNWGAVGIDPNEMDIDAQRLAFESYAKAHELSILEEPSVTPVRRAEDAPKAPRKSYRASVEEVEDVDEPLKPQKLKAPAVVLKSEADSEGARASSMAATAKARVANAVAGRSNSVSVKSTVSNEMRAVSQIAPGSYLANALANVRRGSVSDDEGPPSSSDSSSSSSLSSNESSGDESSISDTSSVRTQKRRRGSSKRKRRTSKRMKASRSTLKPIPPKEYDGNADSRAYHRFVTEGSDYVRTGKVSKKRRVFVLSYYLKGRAYDYYTQKVSLNVYDWTLEQFFEGLFDYCFPVNYRMKQREKLRRAFQNDKSVSDYCHELEELFNTIGDIAERDKVIKLWNGLRGSLQQGLWRDRLNPDVSSWDMVKAAAEVIEISESVASVTGGREARRPKRSRWLGGGSTGGQQRGGPNTPSTYQPSTPAASSPGRNGKSNGYNSNRQSNTPGRPNPSRPPAKNEGRRPGGREASSLSKSERDDLLAQGKCFRCKESGHLSRNCPRGNTVKGTRGGGAPGLSSNNVEFDFEEIDHLRELAESTETLGDTLTVNFMHFQAEGPMKWDPDPTVKRRPCNGDFAAQRAVQLLTLKAPYPGDGPPKLHPAEPRFEVAEVDGGLHSITDYEHPLTEPELICTYLLFEPEFNLPKWYADKRAFRNGGVLDPGNQWENSPPMGPVLSLGLVAALQEGMEEYPEDLDGIRDTEWSVATYDDGA